MPELPESDRISNYRFENGWHTAEPYTDTVNIDDRKGLLLELLSVCPTVESHESQTHVAFDEADDLLFAKVTSRDPKAFLAVLHRLRELGFAIGSDLRGTQ